MKTRRRRNVYGETLIPCRKDDSLDMSGSWDSNGICSELDGGVHQICFDLEPETMSFSKDTYQSDWSRERLGSNHCMCLGAWALYKARQAREEIPVTFDELVCDAIPESVFDPEYINIWSTWNGHELEGQIHNGIDSLYQQCSRKAGKKSRRRFIDRKYNTLKTYIASK